MKLPTLQDWLAAAMIALLAYSLHRLMEGSIPAENRDLVIAIVSGVIGAGVKDVIGWAFGGSKGASENRALTQAALDKLPSPVVETVDPKEPKP